MPKKSKLAHEPACTYQGRLSHAPNAHARSAGQVSHIADLAAAERSKFKIHMYNLLYACFYSDCYIHVYCTMSPNECHVCADDSVSREYFRLLPRLTVLVLSAYLESASIIPQNAIRCLLTRKPRRPAQLSPIKTA